MVSFFKFLNLIAFVRKCFRNARARDGWFDPGVDVCRLFFDGFTGRFHRKTGFHHKPDTERHEKKHRKSDPPFDKEHRNKRAEHGQRWDQKILRSVVGKLGDFKQIRCSAGQQFACADLVVEAERQRLDVRKDIPAHIGLHAHAEQVTPVIDDIKHNGANNVSSEDRADHHGEQRD